MNIQKKKSTKLFNPLTKAIETVKLLKAFSRINFWAWSCQRLFHLSSAQTKPHQHRKRFFHKKRKNRIRKTKSQLQFLMSQFENIAHSFQQQRENKLHRHSTNLKQKYNNIQPESEEDGEWEREREKNYKLLLLLYIFLRIEWKHQAEATTTNDGKLLAEKRKNQMDWFCILWKKKKKFFLPRLLLFLLLLFLCSTKSFFKKNPETAFNIAIKIKKRMRKFQFCLR